MSKYTYKQLLDKREELIEELNNSIAILDKEIQVMEEEFDKKADESKEGIFEIGDNLLRVKTVSTKVDSEKFRDFFDKKIIKLPNGDKILEEAKKVGITTRETFNRMNFIKGAKTAAKGYFVDVNGVIKAIEEEASEKIIRFKTVDVTKVKV